MKYRRCEISVVTLRMAAEKLPAFTNVVKSPLKLENNHAPTKRPRGWKHSALPFDEWKIRFGKRLLELRKVRLC